MIRSPDALFLAVREIKRELFLYSLGRQCADWNIDFQYNPVAERVSPMAATMAKVSQTMSKPAPRERRLGRS
jgi:hypothetical protein